MAFNAIHGNICVSRDIVNLVKDVRNICMLLKEVNVSYCVRECNRETDRMLRVLINNCYNCTVPFVVFLIEFKNIYIKIPNLITQAR